MPDEILNNEKLLLLLIADGDEVAFTTLYRLYVPRLASFLNGLTHAPQVTDELIQETFLQLWLHRDKLPEVEQPKAWVFRIAANITYNFLKRKLVEKKALGSLTYNVNQDPKMADEKLYLNQLLNTLKEAVDQLTPQRKKIYLLSRETGMTIPEIAEKMQLSNSTVKNTLVTSLKQIREHLRHNGFTIGCFLICCLPFYEIIV